MLLPGQRPAIARPAHAGAFEERADGGVYPQVKVCTPCVRVGGGQWCFNLPIIGRKCLNVPSLGTWKACCSTRFGWPPVTCGIQRC
jgi:hypothetical protein